MKKVVTILLVSALGFGIAPSLLMQDNSGLTRQQLKLTSTSNFSINATNLSFSERRKENEEEDFRSFFIDSSYIEPEKVAYQARNNSNSDTKKAFLTHWPRAPPINFT